MENIKNLESFLSEKKKSYKMLKRGSISDIGKEGSDEIQTRNVKLKETPKSDNKNKKAKRIGLGDIKENTHNRTVTEAKEKNYMFFQNIEAIKNMSDEILKMNSSKIDMILSDNHGWASDHISTSKDDVEEVYHFLKSRTSK